MTEKIFGLTDKEIAHVEESLGVRFSDDFKKLNKEKSYEFFDGFDFYNFGSDDGAGVINVTLKARENVNLPKDTLVLAESGDSVILLRVNNGESIYWLDYPELDQYCNGLLPRPENYKNLHEFLEAFNEDVELPI